MPNETAENMKALRNRVRNKRGRVTKRPGVKVKAVKLSVLTRHVHAQKAHIGRLKEGWSKAAEWANVSMPSWVPTETERGLFKDDIKTHTLRGALTAENSVPYAIDRLKGKFMDWLLRKRVRDLTNGKYAMRWEKKMIREFKKRKRAAA
jgi:hypothetical protein